MTSDEVQEVVPLASWELTCRRCYLAYNGHLPSCTNCQAVDITVPTWFNASNKEATHGIR